MSISSNIEWTDATWNPLLGCDKCSAGCAHCYAIRTAWRLMHNPNPKIATAYSGLVEQRADGSLNWTGNINLIHERLREPMGWRKPRRIFVNSQSDLFHEDVPESFIDRVFAVMAVCPQHIFQVLTKRPERMAQYLNGLEKTAATWAADARCMKKDFNATDLLNLRNLKPIDVGGGLPSAIGHSHWPFPNVWLGVSVENQKAADERIPHLLKTPAAVRFLSCEPLLGAVDLTDMVVDDGRPGEWHVDCVNDEGLHPDDDPDFHGALVDWVICGCESGVGARTMETDWARSLRAQCEAADVPFFMKQMFVDGKLRHDMADFPADLRVREFPELKQEAA